MTVFPLAVIFKTVTAKIWLRNWMKMATSAMNSSDTITATVSSLVTALYKFKIILLGCVSFVRTIRGRVIPGYGGEQIPYFDTH
jgi:hypothetical protein